MDHGPFGTDRFTQTNGGFAATRHVINGQDYGGLNSRRAVGYLGLLIAADERPKAMFWIKLGQGVAVGAAGVTALNAITYLDMAVRARPSSDMPSQVVERLTERAGASIPGEGDDHDNRLAGLGPLAGIATGVAVGVAAAFARPVLKRLPSPLAMTVLGALAMAGSDGPLFGLGLTRPGDWSAADWASDLIPHLGYGVATYAALNAVCAAC